ncbi:MAG: alpha/beta fold hydrolase [Flavobacteriaceae bacterium]|nr:alpha/beta fold hydrolase [Flavobacteriaceae bacterium]
MGLLHSRILGKGKPFLILHGFLGMGDNWKTLGNKFAENYEVHLIDQRNHGRSFHSSAFDFELLTNDLLYYIEHYNLENVILLGHSMGGKTAMLFAVNYPEKIEKLIIADISPREYPTHHQDILVALNAIDFTVQKSRKEIEEVLKKYISNAGIRMFLMKNVTRNGKEGYKYRFNLEVLTENYNEIIIGLPSLTQFDKDILFLSGEKSGYIGKDDVPLIESHFPKSSIVTVKNAGHWIHADNPTQFYDEVVSFLDK